ncbi:hypothetical protein GH714_021607, partial [Hevea brasiliensis]
MEFEAVIHIDMLNCGFILRSTAILQLSVLVQPFERASGIGAIGKGEQIHAWILKSGFKSSLHSSIDMHFRCGDIEAAFQVCNGMGDRNVMSWTSMVTDFSKHGFAVRALETFHKMLEAGRSGCLKEAMEFINSLPFKADALVLPTFSELVEYMELGYVPNTDFVLHDVEQEQKEQYLFQQGEKIAVAVGFISASKFKPSRVFKNLRVCGDCHTAFKYFFSIVKGRQIVVRDSNRFHHFKDGKFSRNDYW